MSFPRYPTYKNTVTDWLGEVPEHWSVNRFKLSVESCTNGVWGEEASNDENDVTCIRVADFDRHRLEARDPDEPTIRNVSDRDIEQRSLRKGDLLIEKSGGGEKQPVGAVVLYIGTPPAVCSNFVARMRLKRGQSPSFWRYAHHAAYSLRVNTKSIKQTSGIQNLDQQQYLDESAAYPSLDEQLAIATFLDRETAKIDALSAEQQRLIELLQEKRQAVISHAVTKGLNPNAPMKDSGVEWLGEVPEHWEVVQVRRITESHKQGFYSNEGYVEQGVNLLRITDIQDDASIDTSESPKVDENSVPNEFLLEKGDFVFARTGGAGSYGFVDELSSPTAFASYLIRFRFAASIEPGFLRLYFLSKLFLEGIASSIHGGVNQNVHAEDIKNQWLALAPKEEQQAIASKVFGVLDRYAALSSSIEDEIRLLNERRSALISAAVTGQIDVRVLVEAEDSEQ